MRDWIRNHQLLAFFGISYAIAFITVFGEILLKPGQPMTPWSLTWFLFVFSPSISAVLVAWASGGLPAVRRVLSGFTRWNVGLRWYLAAAFMLLSPLAIALIYISLGNPAAGLQPGMTIPLLLGQVFFQFFSGPFSEEAGWRGFALPRLQARYSALVSSLILGVLWTCWHLPLFFQTGQSQMGIPFPIYLLLSVTLTVYMTWLYNNTHGSLVVTVFCHFAYNLTGTLVTGTVSLIPAMTFYMIAGPLLFLVVIGVVVYFGPRRLSRKAESELPFEAAQPRLGAASAV